MTCPNCGYMMTPFEKSCPRCALHPPKKPLPVSASPALNSVEKERAAALLPGLAGAKICPRCSDVNRPELKHCLCCGYEFMPESAPKFASASLQAPLPSDTSPTAPTSSPSHLKFWNLLWVIPIMAFGLWNMATRPDAPSPSHLEGIQTPMSSMRLDQDYQNNLFAADQKYKDKLMTLEGPVKEIGKSEDGYPYVILYGSEDGRGVLCVFDQGAENALSQLSVNARAQIIGQCKGKSDDDIVMGSCVLPKQEPRSIIPPDPQGVQKAMTGME